MRRIADECNAKVRLRGIGSGFLEGSDGTEANMPLQLNVSCTEYPDYVGKPSMSASTGTHMASCALGVNVF
ncbi:unnamed protein product [Symbiodinium natans]|uniref:KHDC4/BBP-like KH-domain type I domain-containing protein n=1 Tax=Symbiodinium natans TaxID=878477 RepID=A0A812H3A5_9DINO|nr:unnamed protein product [Symbiodinium natans]